MPAPRLSLRERLEQRRPEIEQAILARVYAVSDPSEVGDLEYALGLREAVCAAVSYGIAEIEAVDGTEAASPPVPAELLTQARQAVRNGVSLDIVLRRYFAGYALLGDFVMQVAEETPAAGHVEVHRVMRAVSSLLDHLLVAITAEYHREREGRMRNSEQRRAEHVKGLLAGEAVESSELGYGLDAWHLGAVASGPGAADLAHSLATALGRDLLLVRPEESTVWIWLGGQGRIGARQALALAEASIEPPAILAFGEPGQGTHGWRLTHRQAKAAMPIALRGEHHLTCYADVGLLASIIDDDALRRSLNDTYLMPLTEGMDGGAALRETLRAYFATGRNSTSAAAALGVSRRTVTNRLRGVEDRIGRPLSSCAPELEMALRLDQISDLAPGG